MSARGYDLESIDYEVENIGFRSDTTKISFHYGEDKKAEEDLAYRFMQDFTTKAEIFGHRISFLNLKPGIKQEGNSIYLPNRTEDEAEELAEEYLEDLK